MVEIVIPLPLAETGTLPGWDSGLLWVPPPPGLDPEPELKPLPPEDADASDGRQKPAAQKNAAA
jgi:hypothetical protein